MTEATEVTTTVLVVEDNGAVRDALGMLLECSGYRVLQAASGAEATATTQRDRPDLVLLDLGLPDMNGLEVVRRLKADEETQTIPVVALTGRSLDEDRDACMAAGCSGYLVKPIGSAELLRLMPSLIAI